MSSVSDREQFKRYLHELETRMNDLLAEGHVGSDVKKTLRDMQLVIKYARESSAQVYSADISLMRRRLSHQDKQFQGFKNTVIVNMSKMAGSIRAEMENKAEGGDLSAAKVLRAMTDCVLEIAGQDKVSNEEKAG